jgi:hypothetical protein
MLIKIAIISSMKSTIVSVLFQFEQEQQFKLLIRNISRCFIWQFVLDIADMRTYNVTPVDFRVTTNENGFELTITL